MNNKIIYKQFYEILNKKKINFINIENTINNYYTPIYQWIISKIYNNNNNGNNNINSNNNNIVIIGISCPQVIIILIIISVVYILYVIILYIIILYVIILYIIILYILFIITIYIREEVKQH